MTLILMTPARKYCVNMELIYEWGQRVVRLLENKICLVTGCGRGIGRAIVERFAQEGACVYANSLISEPIEDWSVELAKETGTRIVPMYFDITDSAAVKQAMMTIKANEKRLDVLVNNAGLPSNEKLGMIRHDSMQKVFAVNVFGLIEVLQVASRLMTRQNSGSIINISSIVGQRGNKGQLTYSASKGAVIAVTKSAAKELAEKNIRVNSVAPGLTDTVAMHSAEGQYLVERINNIGMKRLAQPVDIANACVFLASDLSSYISGEIIGVNGCSIL